MGIKVEVTFKTTMDLGDQYPTVESYLAAFDKDTVLASVLEDFWQDPYIFIEQYEPVIVEARVI